MALNIFFSPQFLDSLESILSYYDERNGNDRYSKKLLVLFRRQIGLLSEMPDIGRNTNYDNIKILFVDDYGIEYEKREEAIIIIDIYSCQTNPALRRFRKR